MTEKLDELELFWDSEAPRIGETGAQGWAATETNSAIPPEHVSNPLPVALRPPASMSDGYQIWVHKEEEEMLKCQHPARLTDSPNDSSDEEDVYRVVLFADIRSLLFSIPPVHHPSLLLRYLNFCGLPLPLPSESSNDLTEDLHHLAPDQYFKKTSLSEAPAFEIIAGEAMESVRQAGIGNLASGYGKRWPASFDLLWPSKDASWFSQWPTADYLTHVKLVLVR